MTIITDLIEDLKSQLEVLTTYIDVTEIDSNKIKPLWWTDRYGKFIAAGFCHYEDVLYRFQAIFSDFSSNTHIFILQEPTEEQRLIELEKIVGWEELVGYQRTYIGETGSWKIKDVTPPLPENIDKFTTKFFDEKKVGFKNPTNYSLNKAKFIFTID